jgi:sulfatase modifying factor 1
LNFIQEIVLSAFYLFLLFFLTAFNYNPLRFAIYGYYIYLKLIYMQLFNKLFFNHNYKAPFKSFILGCLVIGGCTAHHLPSKYNVPIIGRPIALTMQNAELRLIWVKPGSFEMGSPVSEKGRKADEGPQTLVTLTEGYWLGATEITIGQWRSVTGMSLRDKVNNMLNDETLYDFAGKKSRIRDMMGFDKNAPDKIIANENNGLPMYFVSWYEAMDFCTKLTAQEKAKGRLPEGYAYNLPTEAQWEFACRAGTSGPLYNDLSGDEGLSGIAWYGKNSGQNYIGKAEGNTKAGPRNAGEKKPNRIGAYDMLGNLWEWCRDWYGPLPGGNLSDPSGPALGMYKINKGGSWGSGLNDERAGNRAQNPPNEASAWRGFRVVLCRTQ